VLFEMYKMISGRPLYLPLATQHLGGFLCLVWYMYPSILAGCFSSSTSLRFIWRKVEVLDIGFFVLLGLGEEKKQFYACLKLPYLYLSFAMTSRYILFLYKILCSYV